MWRQLWASVVVRDMLVVIGVNLAGVGGAIDVHDMLRAIWQVRWPVLTILGNTSPHNEERRPSTNVLGPCSSQRRKVPQTVGGWTSEIQLSCIHYEGGACLPAHLGHISILPNLQALAQNHLTSLQKAGAQQWASSGGGETTCS